MRWWRATPAMATRMPTTSSTLPEESASWNGTTVACTNAATSARIGRYRCERIQAMVPPGSDFFSALMRLRAE